MDLTDNKTFQIFFVSCFVAAIVIVFTIRYILKRKGVHIDSKKNILLFGLSIGCIGALPVWLHPSVSVLFKMGLLIAGIAAGIGYFFSIELAEKVFKQHFGFEGDEDKKKETNRERTKTKKRKE